jgi:hypothetical protein
MPPVVLICRFAIRLAALLAPGELRAEWRGPWLAEIGHGYATLMGGGMSVAEARRTLTRFTRGAFADAADLRLSRTDLRGTPRHPASCLALLAVLLCVLCGLTGGLPNCRQAAAGLDVRESETLVLLSKSSNVLGFEAAPTAADFLAWRQQGVDASLAGFVVEGRILRVTSNFFEVLGTVPRLPFRFLRYRIEAVEPLYTQPKRLGVIARLKNASAVAQFKAAKGGYVKATPVNRRLREPLWVAAGFLAAALLVAGIAAPGSFRAARFYFAKAVLAQFTIAAAWVECAAGMPLDASGGLRLTAALVLPASLFAAMGLAAWWSVDDQKRRCPACCRLLSMPVRIGSRSSILLDRPGVEVLCPGGHGSLFVPEPVIHGAERPTWTAFDKSWTDCLEQGGSR